MRGGETEVVTNLYVSAAAHAEYTAFVVGVGAGQLATMLKGVTVRRFADNSPYWIHVDGAARYVFVRKRKRAEGSGAFALVGVKRTYGYEPESEG